MTYAEIIDWIEKKYTTAGYDFFSTDDLTGIRQQLISDFDKDKKLKHFIEGSPERTAYMKRLGKPKWTGIEGTFVERDLFSKVEKGLIDEQNEGIEDSFIAEIQDADTSGKVTEIEIPTNLEQETIDRLEEVKNDQWEDLRGGELREELEDPTSDRSLKNIGKEAKKLPDEATSQELIRDIKEEQSKLKELNQDFLEQIREQTDEAGLNVVIGNVEASDLRAGQKEALQRVADARREFAFPEPEEL